MAFSLSPLLQFLSKGRPISVSRLALLLLMHAPACINYAQICCITVSNKLKLCAWVELLLLHLLRFSAKHIVCLELPTQTLHWLKSTEVNNIAAAASAHPLPSTHGLLAKSNTDCLNSPNIDITLAEI